MKSLTDARQLLSGLRVGEESAYLRLFDEFFAPLHNYARRLLSDAEAANDVVQEVFCHLYEVRHTLADDTELTPLLYRSVYNRCVTSLRHTMVMQQYANEQQQDFIIDQLLQHPEAEVVLRQRDIRQAVNEALAQLPPRCREVFVRSKMQGLSNRQIADELDISVKTVEAQMTKALGIMRHELQWLVALTCFALLQNSPA